MQIEEFFDIKLFADKEVQDARLAQVKYITSLADPTKLFLEFGVFKGATINHAAEHNPNVTIYGFDSFVGLPENWDLGGKFAAKDVFHLHGKLPKVKDNVHLINGFFDKTLKPWLLEHPGDAGYINIDCDIYSSTKYVLTTLNNRIVAGTYIIFDELCDWRLVTKSEPHEKRLPTKPYTTWAEHEWKAMNEWLEECGRAIVPVSRNWSHGAAVKVVK